MEGQFVIDALIRALGDESSRQASQDAIHHLAQNPHPELVVESLLAVLRDDSNKSRLRERAALALARMACPRADESFYAPVVEQVLALLKGQDANLKGWMIDGLGAIPRPANPMHPDLVMALVGLIDDRYVLFRVGAVTALGHSKDPGAVPHLITKLEDGLWTVRKRAVLALCELKDARAMNPIQELAATEYARKWILDQFRGAFEGQNAEPAPSSTPKRAPRVSVSAPENAHLYYKFARLSDPPGYRAANSVYGPGDFASEKMLERGWGLMLSIANREIIDVYGDEQPSPELLQSLRADGLLISIRDETPVKAAPSAPVSPVIAAGANLKAPQVQGVETKSKGRHGWNLAVGWIFTGAGLVIGLLLGVIYVTSPELIYNTDGFIVMMTLCPAPLLSVGIILLLVGIFRTRKARK